jgi:type I restriction enzyme, S subunit
MRTVRLGEITKSLRCDYGDDPFEGAVTVNVVKVSNINGEGHFHGEFELRSFRPEKLDDLLVREGELLVAKSSGSKVNVLSGKTAICDTERAGRLVASNFLLRLRADEAAVFPRYLWRVLNSPASKAFVKTIVAAFTYPNLNWSQFSAHPIPLPPMAEQRRIATILDQVEALRAIRRHALAQLDTLIQSLFLDLFGDPISNPLQWPQMNLEAVFQFRTGKLDSNAAVPSGEFPFFTCSREDLRINTYAFDCEALLLAGNNASADYSVKHYTGKFNAYQRTYVITLLDEANSYEYARFVLEHRLAELKRISKGTNTKYLTLELLNRVRIPVPRYELQRKFAAQVSAVERLKASQRASLAKLDALFASLQHRAFRGEL